ncbi:MULTISPECIES: SCO3374 family protein [Streptomycetaceae]|uniref:Proline-rich protein n=1 Tax=Streptantibioticus cattleyicolor (strain ATCC 35852 / DSM 46488 / JCM 4925 / NBRC 14057 / NRRL 8057) TaxID=1003195 RepID=F8K288_STREN|nr:MULTISPECIES: SCO3374 family protein [Streptomycetaceae]AEW94973.1 hypothetical protein SCATT_26020 [Streptantibioticus cattleyicolor NRRL 8057 = DSM 46488]MYS59574.1 hypothetical protein [Streptomyces sp. SID5468]CCB75324.1 conserved protein of unknown function [Streptantibioticus cattleyicolor NRRL 8057 = DSM 46488]
MENDAVEEAAVRLWYEREMGWPVTGGRPAGLVTGVRFDVLDVPAAAGRAVLRRLPRTGPAALAGDRIWLLVAAGGAEELPGLLDWLDWGGVALDLTARGAGDQVRAPALPGRPPHRGGPVWLRPPVRGCAVEMTLPALTLACGPAGPAADGPVGLVPLVGVVATECHRNRLFPADPPGSTPPRAPVSAPACVPAPPMARGRLRPRALI